MIHSTINLAYILFLKICNAKVRSCGLKIKEKKHFFVGIETFIFSNWQVNFAIFADSAEKKPNCHGSFNPVCIFFGVSQNHLKSI